MSYRIIASIDLADITMTGRTLAAQLFANGSDVGSPITTGFTEAGYGIYLFDYSDIPDGFWGGVKITEDGDDEILAVFAIDPQIAETAVRILRVGVGNVAVIAPVLDSSLVRIVQGDDYDDDDDRALRWQPEEGTEWPDLTGSTVKLYCRQNGVSHAFDCEAPEADLVTLELTADQTDDLQFGDWEYQIVAQLATSNHVCTLVSGTMTVEESLA